MADGWTDQKRRTLINFLVYYPKGTIFLKTVDASEASKTAMLFYKLFRDVVLFVGPKNIVHMVTDNAANYVAASKLLVEEFPSIFWSPCAAHCINLVAGARRRGEFSTLKSRKWVWYLSGKYGETRKYCLLLVENGMGVAT
jgi:hypothetical protein